MPIRLYERTKAAKITAPKEPEGWEALLRRAIQRAEVTTDRRLLALRTALTKGQAEGCLRSLGIICDTDISREFPPKAS